MVDLRKEAGEVVGAKVEDQALECEGAAGAKEMKAGEEGEVAAGRLIRLYVRRVVNTAGAEIWIDGTRGPDLSSHEHQLRSKLLFCVVDKVLGRIEAVIRTGGKGVFGREAVTYRYHREIASCGDVLQETVLASPKLVSAHSLCAHRIPLDGLLLCLKHPSAAMDMHHDALDTA